MKLRMFGQRTGKMVGFSPSEAPVRPPLVVHVIYSLGTGGLENGLVNIINRCPAHRYRHAIVCLTHAEAFAQRITRNDVEVIELHKKAGHDPGVYWRLWRELRRLDPAIVHTRNLAALESQILALLMPGRGRVHGEHGRDTNDLEGTVLKYRLLRRFLQPLIDRFITVSGDLADWLVQSVRIRQDKVTQIYNGVDRTKFSALAVEDCRSWPPGVPSGYPPRAESRVIGTVGRLAAVKDQQLILSALNHIFTGAPDERDRLRCIIVGEGPERETLEKLIHQWGLADCVWLVGESDEIPAILGSLDVFVLSSLGEGISNTILEAMAAGLPVIATDVGGNPELVRDGENGLLIPVGDEKALSDAIQKLLGNPALRVQMGLQSLSRVQQDFDWEDTVASYMRVYDEVLQRCRLRYRVGGA